MQIVYKTEVLDYDGSVLDGLYDVRSDTLVINSSLSLKKRIITFYHECLHVLSHRFLGSINAIVVDNLIDYANFLVELKNLRALIKYRFGIKKLVGKVKREREYMMLLSSLQHRIKVILGNTQL